MLLAELFPAGGFYRVSVGASRGCGVKGDSHGSVDVLHGHLAVDLLHGSAGILHGDEGFLVDVCGFDGVDLLLEHGDLAAGLFEGVLVLLLAFEGVAGGWVKER